MIHRGANEVFRSLQFEQYYLDKLRNVSPEMRVLLPSEIIKKLSKTTPQKVRETLDTKIKILTALGTHSAIIFWEGEVNECEANDIFKRWKYGFSEWKKAEETILEKNIYIVGDKNFSEWMMLTNFYFDTAYYTVTRKLKAPTSKLSETSVTQIINENKVFFRSIYTMMMKYDSIDAHLKNLGINKQELQLLFQLFIENKPMCGADFKDRDGVPYRTLTIKKILLTMEGKQLIEGDRMRTMDNNNASKADYFIMTAKSYLLLGEITERLFKHTEI